MRLQLHLPSWLWAIRAATTIHMRFSLSIPSALTLMGPVISKCKSLPAVETSPAPSDGSDRDALIFQRMHPSTGPVVALLFGAYARLLPATQITLSNAVVTH